MGNKALGNSKDWRALSEESLQGRPGQLYHPLWQSSDIA